MAGKEDLELGDEETEDITGGAEGEPASYKRERLGQPADDTDAESSLFRRR